VVIHDGKMMTALRAALVMLTGENPSGMDAAHGACHNRLCCNPHPEHGASWKTRADNMADKGRDGTARAGSDIPSSRLREWQVRSIHAARASGEPASALAERYGVSEATIGAICSGRRWRHLGLPPVSRKWTRRKAGSP